MFSTGEQRPVSRSENKKDDTERYRLFLCFRKTESVLLCIKESEKQSSVRASVRLGGEEEYMKMKN